MIRIIIACLLLTSFCSCKTKKVNEESQIMYSKNRIEIDCIDTFDPRRLQASFYDAYGLEFECYMHEQRRLAIFRFNPKKISLDDLLEDLKYEVGVEKVKRTQGCIFD